MCISLYAASCRHLLRLRQPLGQTSLFAVRGILMDNALGDSFVYLADCGGVCFFNSSLVFRLQSLVKLFDSGFDCGADHAVAKILLAGYLNALQC